MSVYVLLCEIGRTGLEPVTPSIALFAAFTLFRT